MAQDKPQFERHAVTREFQKTTLLSYSFARSGLLAMMPVWKRMLLGAYLGASTPYRLYRNRQRSAAGEAPMMILFYHRVADTNPNDWTISRRQFAKHVAYLQANFDLVSLQEIQRRLRAKHNPRPAVHLTFDDGYAENCDFALPLLIAQKIPVTYFVTLQNAVHHVPFPHDVESGIPLPPNSIDQLRSLVRDGVEIGCHTRTHPVLANILDPARLRDEVVVAGQELSELVGQKIRYFAVPYGMNRHIHCDVFALAKRAGYEAVVSAYGGYNFAGDDDFHLQRIHGDPSMVELKNWLTVDPRKIRNTVRYPYSRRALRDTPPTLSTTHWAKLSS